MTTGLQISIPQRLAFLRVLLVAGLLVSMAFTWRLWSMAHLYPSVSLLRLETPGFPLAAVLAIVCAICLLGSLFLRWFRVLLSIGLLCLLVLLLCDLNRLQHWVWYYGAMLVVMVFYNGRVDDPNRFTSYFIILQIIVCSLYLFTGIHQLQPRFVSEELPRVIEPLSHLLSARQHGFLLKLGHAIPYVFIFTAISLFVAPMRYLGITIALLLHLSLLLLRYPLRDGDVPGYLMSLVMMPVVLLLFSGKTKQRYFSPTFLLQRPLFYLVIAGFFVLPFLNNSGRWPDALSANVYSGNRDQFAVSLPVQVYLRMPQQVKNFCSPIGSMLRLDHEKWCRVELGVKSDNSAMTEKAIVDRLIYWNHGEAPGLEIARRERLALLSER